MKGIKRVSHFLKQYFVFSRTERKGIYALLVLIALSLVVPRLWVIAFPPEPLQFSITPLPEESKTTLPDGEPTDPGTNAEGTTLFTFNPNTADSATFTTLGFSPRTARSIINYRAKGGRFRKAEDLYRIYNADSALITRIIPYAQIEVQERTSQHYKTEYPVNEHKAFTPVEINTADSLSLVRLYGIGPKMASKIIDHRTRSGGFFTVEQLTEIYGIDEGLLDELKGKIYADASKVHYININTITFEDLKLHPYLRYKTANAIINYRKQHGHFKTVEDLKKIVILPDSTYEKLLPYIRLAD